MLDVVTYSLVKKMKFTKLKDTPKSYKGHASKFVVVNSSEDGLTFGDVPPSGGWTVKKVTSDYTANSNEFLLVDASNGSVTITLPSPSANARVAVKKIDNTSNEVVVDAGTSKIDGTSTFTLRTQYEAYEFYCDGNEWFIL